MSKRQCPFEDDLQPQMKVFFDQKKYELKNEKAMTYIYDKTIQKLFNASKIVHSKVSKENKLPEPEPVTIKHQGSLEKCLACSKMCIRHHKCNFCDKWICEACLTQCVKCENIFCNFCSFKIYSGCDSDTISVCISCSDEDKLLWQ